MTEGNTNVIIKADAAQTGAAAGERAAEVIRAAIAERGRARVIFASAPSQQEMLDTLIAAEGIDWSKVDAFHMDEYIGLPAEHPQAFGQWLVDRIGHLGLGSFERLQAADPAGAQAEIARYSELLAQAPIDLCCMGIGMNGHIAFNEPGDADFETTELVRRITMDEASRIQQVEDGCFADLSEVPTEALSLTVPALVGAGSVVCTVKGTFKAEAVKAALTGPVTTDLPASVLQRHPDARIYLDADAASLLEQA